VGWVDSLRASTVGSNTGPLIYYIEEHPTFLPRVAPFFEAAERGEFRVVASLVTLIEVLVHPLREGQQDLAQQYRDVLLQSANLTLFRWTNASLSKQRNCVPGINSERRMRSKLPPHFVRVLRGS
jgi:hypothetical protein